MPYKFKYLKLRKSTLIRKSLKEIPSYFSETKYYTLLILIKICELLRWLKK